jgi:ribosomal-protein-serine acetyltransferase
MGQGASLGITSYSLDLPRELGATIRRLLESDAPGLSSAVDSERERLERWLLWPRLVTDVNSARRFIAGCQRGADDHYEYYGLFIAERLVGGINLINWAPDNAVLELGAWVTRDAEGTGLMRVACAAAINYARRQLEVERVEWRAGVGNHRSRALAVRLGFTEEGTARSAQRLGERRIDLAVYSLVGQELDAL